MGKHHGTTLVVFAEEVLVTSHVGAALLQPLANTPLRPQRIGRFEPLRTAVASEDDLSALANDWPFLWNAPGGRGFYNAKAYNGLAEVTIAAKPKVDPTIVENIACEYAQNVPLDYAAVVVLTDGEIARARAPRLIYRFGARQRPVFDMNWVLHLSQGIPDVYWVNIIGGRYVRRFGRERVRSAPADVREVAEDVFVVRLCELSEIDGPEAAARREAIKDHLGRDAFW